MSNISNIEKHSNIVHGSFREGAFARIIRQIKDWNYRRQAIRQLKMMPDNLLRDIGIERYEIVDVVNQRGVYAKLPVVHKQVVTETATPEIRRAA